MVQIDNEDLKQVRSEFLDTPSIVTLKMPYEERYQEINYKSK